MLSESAYVCTRSAQEIMVCSFLISHIKSWYSQRSERRKFISQTENGDSSFRTSASEVAVPYSARKVDTPHGKSRGILGSSRVASCRSFL